MKTLLRIAVVVLTLLIPASTYGQRLPKVRAAYTSIAIQMDPIYIMRAYLEGVYLSKPTRSSH
jgi:hypothetical protein